MDFLWTKQTAILDNIANAETPNYKAKVVTFEEDLRAKLEAASKKGQPKSALRKAIEEAAPLTTQPHEATRMDENSVNITEQNVELVRNAYQLQYVMNAINSDLSAVKTAING